LTSARQETSTSGSTTVPAPFRTLSLSRRFPSAALAPRRRLMRGQSFDY
jgi:hypothetical protein